jgi:hypothetical protein
MPKKAPHEMQMEAMEKKVKKMKKKCPECGKMECECEEDD